MALTTGLLSGPSPVLALRALGLGDGLAGVPALRGLRRAFPGRPVVLATAHPVARLLHARGVVDAVLPTPGLDGVPPGLALGRHTAVNLHGRGPQSHRILLAGRPDRLLAFASDDAGVAGPPWDPAEAGAASAREHETERWCRLVRETTGADCAPSHLRLDPPPGVRRDPGLVVLHPGASTPLRRWPTPCWAAVARRLAAGGRRVLVTGGPDEQGLAADVVGGAGLPASADLAGRLGLDALAELVASAGLVLSTDTGVAHLATAFGTPSVVLFGPTPPSEWGPAIDPELHVVLWHGPVPGALSGASTADPSLLRITPAEVIDAASGLLGRRSRARRRRLGVG